MRARWWWSLAALLVTTTSGCRGSGKSDRIAFVSLRSDPPGVHVSYADGSQPVKVSSGRAFVAAAPVWAPDGTRIAYTVETGPDQWAIEVYDVRTGASAQIAKGVKLEDWSPDGQWIVATTLSDTDQILSGKPLKRQLQQIYAIPANAEPGAKRIKLSDGAGWDYSPAVSPDSTRVVFASNRNDKVELRTVNIGGGGGKRIVQFKGEDVLGSPAWSRDNATIVFECTRGAGATQKLCSVSSAGGNATDLTAGWAASPVWSPDGTRLAYVAKDAEGSEQIFVMPAAGGAPTAITDDGRNTLPAWSPDGKRIAFVSDAPGNPDVMVVSAEGGSPTNVTGHVSRDGFPSWQPPMAPKTP